MKGANRKNVLELGRPVGTHDGRGGNAIRRDIESALLNSLDALSAQRALRDLSPILDSIPEKFKPSKPYRIPTHRQGRHLRKRNQTRTLPPISDLLHAYHIQHIDKKGLISADDKLGDGDDAEDLTNEIQEIPQRKKAFEGHSEDADFTSQYHHSATNGYHHSGLRSGGDSGTSTHRTDATDSDWTAMSEPIPIPVTGNCVTAPPIPRVPELKKNSRTALPLSEAAKAMFVLAQSRQLTPLSSREVTPNRNHREYDHDHDSNVGNKQQQQSKLTGGTSSSSKSPIKPKVRREFNDIAGAIEVRKIEQHRTIRPLDITGTIEEKLNSLSSERIKRSQSLQLQPIGRHQQQLASSTSFSSSRTTTSLTSHELNNDNRSSSSSSSYAAGTTTTIMRPIPLLLLPTVNVQVAPGDGVIDAAYNLYKANLAAASAASNAGHHYIAGYNPNGYTASGERILLPHLASELVLGDTAAVATKGMLTKVGQSHYDSKAALEMMKIERKERSKKPPQFAGFWNWGGGNDECSGEGRGGVDATTTGDQEDDEQEILQDPYEAKQARAIQKRIQKVRRMQELYQAERAAGAGGSGEEHTTTTDGIAAAGRFLKNDDSGYIDPNWLMSLQPSDLGGSDVTEDDLLAVAKYFSTGGNTSDNSSPKSQLFSTKSSPQSIIPLQRNANKDFLGSPRSTSSPYNKTNKPRGGAADLSFLSDDLSSEDGDEDNHHHSDHHHHYHQSHTNKKEQGGNDNIERKTHHRANDKTPPQFQLHPFQVVISAGNTTTTTTTNTNTGTNTTTILYNSEYPSGTATTADDGLLSTQRSVVVSEVAVMPVRSLHRTTEEEGELGLGLGSSPYAGSPGGPLDEMSYAGSVDGLLNWTKGLDLDDIY